MSTEARVKGTLTFESEEILDDLLDQLGDEDELDTYTQEITKQIDRDGASLTFNLHLQLSNEANLWFQDWLTDMVEEAATGHLDTWQEEFGDSMYVRISAGSDDEEQIDGPFPE